MDRPRCYILVREDYLWSPLQSACSMQHLRSVWCDFLGRQCARPPPPTCPAASAHPLSSAHICQVISPPLTAPVPSLMVQVPWATRLYFILSACFLKPFDVKTCKFVHGYHCSNPRVDLCTHIFPGTTCQISKSGQRKWVSTIEWKVATLKKQKQILNVLLKTSFFPLCCYFVPQHV